MSGHTPGPWAIEYDNGDNGGEWLNVGPATITLSRGAAEQHIGYANAHLIAAAPEMYEMLRRISDHARQEGSFDLPMNDLRRVLARAEGRS